ncbi:metalloprotease [Candidatus Woesearchaeota archaeon CG08_land_8_20_14_0_20_47_9]|nr:MAG: metalloprotease [Candidatus Woesearchaeota archaeon CG08_land_8_20_14_0_20_47_9]
MIRFSRLELEHLAKALVMLSFAFAIANSGIRGIFSSLFIIVFVIAALTLGLGFVAHELAHKLVAQRHGCFAEFRANMQMLLVAVAMSFLGFFFAAPGGVVIGGNMTRKAAVRISSAGILANLAVAVGFFVTGIFAKGTGVLGLIASEGYMINSWLAIFNILPLWGFDGEKIMGYDRRTYWIVASLCAFVALLQFVV